MAYSDAYRSQTAVRNKCIHHLYTTGRGGDCGRTGFAYLVQNELESALARLTTGTVSSKLIFWSDLSSYLIWCFKYTAEIIILYILYIFINLNISQLEYTYFFSFKNDTMSQTEHKVSSGVWLISQIWVLFFVMFSMLDRYFYFGIWAKWFAVHLLGWWLLGKGSGFQ